MCVRAARSTCCVLRCFVGVRDGRATCSADDAGILRILRVRHVCSVNDAAAADAMVASFLVRRRWAVVASSVHGAAACLSACGTLCVGVVGGCVRCGGVSECVVEHCSGLVCIGEPIVRPLQHMLFVHFQ